MLTFFWICELCGSSLGEVTRAGYVPRYNPVGAERAGEPAATAAVAAQSSA